MTKRTTSKKLGLERLEAREVMAGNVSVQVIANEVIVRGDNLDNQIEISQLDNGAFRVRGLNGTTINNQSFVDRLSIHRDLRVYLNGGNDWLHIGNPTNRPTMVVEDLEVDAGTGSDAVAITNIRTTDNQDAVFRLGNESHSELDADNFYAFRATIATGLRVETGSGADDVGLDRSTINGRLRVELGSGNDNLQLSHVVFASSDMNGGSGRDRYGRLNGTPGTIRGFEVF